MRQTLALVLGAALGATVVAHTVVAQPATEPPRPAPQMKMQHGQMGHGGMMRQGGAECQCERLSHGASRISWCCGASMAREPGPPP